MMKAIVILEQGKAAVSEVPVPAVRANYVRVKTIAVALNPTDWKHIDYFYSSGTVVGCDFVGFVEEIGSAVTSRVQKGDRIAGMVHGSNPSSHRDGCFAEYCEVKDGLFIRVPDPMRTEDAATLGVGCITVGQALYQTLKIPWPIATQQTSTNILIYGGGTATGTLAIQMAKLSGLTVFTTASPRNHAALRELGADVVLDYKEPHCAANIRQRTANQLRLVFDTIGTAQSFEFCAAAMSSNPQLGLELTTLRPTNGFPRTDVNTHMTLAYTEIGEPFERAGKEIPGDATHYEFGKKLWRLIGELLTAGKLKTHSVEVRSGGLQGVLEGLDDLRSDRVSGKKLVYKLE